MHVSTLTAFLATPLHCPLLLLLLLTTRHVSVENIYSKYEIQCLPVSEHSADILPTILARLDMTLMTLWINTVPLLEN